MEINYSLLSQNANILVVDDTKENLFLLVQMLKDCGYVARPVPNGRLALQAARSEKPDLILLDITMPEMDGYEVCLRMKQDETLREIPILFISALSDTNEKVKAFKVGGVDYITKPFQFEEVKARVETHLNLRHLQVDLEEQVKKQVKEISDLQMSMIFGLAKLTEARDKDTGRHIDRIQVLCRILAEHLRKKPDFQELIDLKYIERLFYASPLHDIGKVGISDQILLKPGKFTAEEYEIMKSHTIIGSQTLEEVKKRYTNNEFLNMGIQIARSHHERWDGTGYPDGLKGYDIPLSARIMAIVDTYDAVRSKRVYKPAISHPDACVIIQQESGTHFDPTLVDAFWELENQFCQIWLSQQE